MSFPNINGSLIFLYFFKVKFKSELIAKITTVYEILLRDESPLEARLYTV